MEARSIPGSLLISKLSCRFSSYDIGLALSSSSESKAPVGGGAGFFLPGGAEAADLDVEDLGFLG